MLKIVEKAPSVLQLAPDVWHERIKTYVSARLTKKSADAVSRSADKVLKPVKDEILLGLGDAKRAQCGNVFLEVKHGAPVQASVTLPDGIKVPWSDVSTIVVGNHIFPASQCKPYGGREGSTDILCDEGD